jgi:hypothetical protein
MPVRHQRFQLHKVYKLEEELPILTTAETLSVPPGEMSIEMAAIPVMTYCSVISLPQFSNQALETAR